LTVCFTSRAASGEEFGGPPRSTWSACRLSRSTVCLLLAGDAAGDLLGQQPQDRRFLRGVVVHV
jgi:hypothetical protein